MLLLLHFFSACVHPKNKNKNKKTKCSSWRRPLMGHRYGQWVPYLAGGRDSCASASAHWWWKSLFFYSLLSFWTIASTTVQLLLFSAVILIRNRSMKRDNAIIIIIPYSVLDYYVNGINLSWISFFFFDILNHHFFFMFRQLAVIEICCIIICVNLFVRGEIYFPNWVRENELWFNLNI